MRTGFQTALIDKERRAEGRRRLFLVTSATRSGKQVPVEILDLSAKGVMLSTRARLESGELLAVVLADDVSRGASVVWSSGRMFGCRFLEPLSKAELSASLLASHPAREGGDIAAPSLGQRIRSLRLASTHSMEELAHLVGVSKPTLWRWETDQVRPRPQALERLAALFGGEETELLFGGQRFAEPTLGREAAPDTSTVSQIVERARNEIASIAGVAPRQVRITIDFS